MGQGRGRSQPGDSGARRRPGAGGTMGGASGANWGDGRSSSGSRAGGSSGGLLSRSGNSGANWNTRQGGQGGGYDESSADWRSASGPGRSGSGGRNRRSLPQPPDYEEVDLGRALVPSRNDLAPMLPETGVPVIPGFPETDDEERALGIRRPAYIPATGEKRKRKLSSWRVVSGVLSVMLVCVASCGAAGFLGKQQIDKLLLPPIKTVNTPATIDFSQVPATPIGTPGPAANVVKSAVTALGVDKQYNPVNVTSHFTVDATVYVVVRLVGVPAKTSNTLSIGWYIKGPTGFQNIDPTGALDQNIPPQTVSTFNAYFSLPFHQPGVGMAKIYWNKAKSDSGEAANDPTLAQTILFAVQPANSTPGTGSGTTTPTPTKGKSYGIGLPVAWRQVDRLG